MAIRFFILQAHYRSTLDFSNEALQASEKGYQRLMAGLELLGKIRPVSGGTLNPSELEAACADAMNDDLNTPMVIAHLFDGLKMIHQAYEAKEGFTEENLERMRRLYRSYLSDLLGLQEPSVAEEHHEALLNYLIQFVCDLRLEAKAAKDYAASDRIRNKLSELGVEIRDKKDGCDWTIK
jgi:cysteinyl-tRNA synthetase